MLYDYVEATATQVEWDDETQTYVPVLNREYSVKAENITAILNRKVPTARDLLEQHPAKGMGRRVHKVSEKPVGRQGKQVPKQRQRR